MDEAVGDGSTDPKPNSLLLHRPKKLKRENPIPDGVVDLQLQRRHLNQCPVAEGDPRLLLDKGGLILIIVLGGEALHHLRKEEGPLHHLTLPVRVMNLRPLQDPVGDIVGLEEPNILPGSALEKSQSFEREARMLRL